MANEPMPNVTMTIQQPISAQFQLPDGGGVSVHIPNPKGDPTEAVAAALKLILTALTKK